MKIINVLPDGKFSLTDAAAAHEASSYTMGPALTEKELLEELVRQGHSREIASDLITRAKEKGTEIF